MQTAAKTIDPSITVWSGKDGITVYIGDGGFRATATLTAEGAERLIDSLRRTIDGMPRVATSADLGLEA